MAFVSTYRELEVYKKARALSLQVFEMTKEFPREEIYSLTDQIRRSSRSVGAQIAEAWGKRRYEKHFISKLTDADAEQLETQHWIEVAQDCSYLVKEQAEEYINEYITLGKMIGAMINKSSLFCENFTK